MTPMDTYAIVKLRSGNILLRKTVIDYNEYDMVHKPNGDILLIKAQKKVINNIDEIKQYDFSKSTIKKGTLNDVPIETTKFRPFLNEVYSLIDDGTTIIKNTTMNIKTVKKTTSGFYYLENIGISVQGTDINKCLMEIIIQCTKNEISVFIEIKTCDDSVIVVNL